jgi:hypothetical protein
MRIRRGPVRRSRVLIGAAAAIPMISLCLAVPAASAYTPVPPPTPQTFQECPVNGAIQGHYGRVTVCVVGVASQGLINIGSLDTTFHGPGVVDGGTALNSATQPNWVDALNGKSFTSPKQLMAIPVMTMIGNPSIPPPADSDVWVEASQAGAMGFSLITPGQGLNPLTVVPLSFHLMNPVLGPNCYIGTDADPITLNLTTGISGALTGTLGTLSTAGFSGGLYTTGTEVVDGTFSTPGATGCGPAGVYDAAIDTVGNLPSPSGANEAILYGNFDLATVKWVKRHLHET